VKVLPVFVLVDFIVILTAGVLLLLLLVFWDRIFGRLSRIERPKTSIPRTIYPPKTKTPTKGIEVWLFAIVIIIGLIVSIFVSYTVGAAIVMLYPVIQNYLKKWLEKRRQK
jgi:hypothetical protein